MATTRLGHEPMTKNPLADHEPETGYVYSDSRSDDLHQLIYCDDQVVLLRSETTDKAGENHHRMNGRAAFDRMVEADRLEYKPDADLDLISASDVDWSEVPHIGEKTTEHLHEEDYRSIIDIRQAEDSELLTVDGLGVAGLDNLREFAE